MIWTDSRETYLHTTFFISNKFRASVCSVVFSMFGMWRIAIQDVPFSYWIKDVRYAVRLAIITNSIGIIGRCFVQQRHGDHALIHSETLKLRYFNSVPNKKYASTHSISIRACSWHVVRHWNDYDMFVSISCRIDFHWSWHGCFICSMWWALRRLFCCESLLCKFHVLIPCAIYLWHAQ